MKNEIEIINQRDVELLEKTRKINLQKLFTEEGMNEIISAIKAEVKDFKADISTKEGVELLYKSAAKEFGGVSVLVNNASSAINPKPFELMDWEDVQNQLNTQLKGSFLLCQSCIPKMIERGWGRIVNITSQVVEGEPTPSWTSYAIAKASLAKFSSYLAADLGSNGITVNCVSPGMSETGLIGSISEKVQLMIARQTPTRRLTKPEDVAAAVAYLVSSGASQVTGQTILVNGGIVTS